MSTLCAYLSIRLSRLDIDIDIGVGRILRWAGASLLPGVRACDNPRTVNMVRFTPWLGEVMWDSCIYEGKNSQMCQTCSHEPFKSGSRVWGSESQEDSKHGRDSLGGGFSVDDREGHMASNVGSLSEWEWPLAHSQEGSVLHLLQGSESYQTSDVQTAW